MRALLLDGVGGAERAVAGPDLFLGLVRQRPVDDVKQRVVLPHAEAERDRDRRQRDDQPRAQLLEVADDAEPLLVADTCRRRQPSQLLARSTLALIRAQARGAGAAGRHRRRRGREPVGGAAGC